LPADHGKIEGNNHLLDNTTQQETAVIVASQWCGEIPVVEREPVVAWVRTGTSPFCDNSFVVVVT
jgi:hypothetical protein